MMSPLTKSFLRASIFLPLRIILSLIYGFGVSLRNKLYDWQIFSVHKVETPVISVGNISVGGSGKTILVQSLLEFFIQHNLKPAVLSRGYGRQTDDLFLVADESSVLGTVEESGEAIVTREVCIRGLHIVTLKLN